MKPYCPSLTAYKRFRTLEVKAGDLGIGGEHPIRLQSMTTTNTMDTAATVAQSIRMIEAGCELVRITAPSIREAENLENIKKELSKKGFKVPLVADIHFTPNAAETAARIVEKVRVNPGNYADRKKFQTFEYSDADYAAELERIRERFTPLVKICKEYGTAMRIGTNHGSLSDRILSRYGDTPLGMVESAFEFLAIAEDMNYKNMVLSMKASNPKVMVQAYRLLVSKMIETGRNYPLHLGVTEAGDGEDGRIKSAIGIGALLEDGLGDTVRVSLTEDPEFEIPVAKNLVNRYASRQNHQPIPEVSLSNALYQPYEYNPRKSLQVFTFGNSREGHFIPRVILDYSQAGEILPSMLFASGYSYQPETDKWNLSEQACDFIYTGHQKINFPLPGTLGVIIQAGVWDESLSNHFPIFSLEEFKASHTKSPVLNFISVTTKEVRQENFPLTFSAPVVFILETDNIHAMADIRQAFLVLEEKKIKYPVVIRRYYHSANQSLFTLFPSTDAGGLLLDGLGDGIMLGGEGITRGLANRVAFGILQATRTRISKTEFISCPSCGRTLFDLQETTAKIREKTGHLKGLKIGIMGCIVNGPGEMADADYGYVGSGPGKITLYKGKEVVMKNIETPKAVEALVGLIKDNGDWVEKPEA